MVLFEINSTKMSDSDSSDNEEQLKAQKECESNFASNLYATDNNKLCDDPKSKDSLPKSLRYTTDHLDEETAVGVIVTPGVQKYIAKHLSSILDQQLEEVEHTKRKCKKSRISKSKDRGIYLLHGIHAVINMEGIEDISASHNVKWRQRQMKDNGKEEMIKVKESAVSADWILSGEAIKGWVKNTKGEVIQGVFKEVVTSKTKRKKKKKSSVLLETFE